MQRLKSSLILALLFTAAVIGRSALSAPCCGGSSAIPTLITGDDRAQFQVSVSHGSIIGDAPSSGLPVFRSPNDSESLNVLNLAGAYRLFDRAQIGVGIPLISRSLENPETSASSSGTGDLLFDFAYEIIPDFTYSEWRPKGFAFVQLTTPTGPSTYDSSAPYQIDTRGRGFYTLGIGMAFLKTISDFDLTLTFEGHRSFSRTVTSPSGAALDLIPSFGGSLMAGLGWSPGGGSFRIGTSLSPIYEGRIETLGAIQSISDSQIAWNTSLQAGYLLNDEWSTGLNYTDQTLMGPAQNVSLSRSIALSLQHRWPL